MRSHVPRRPSARALIGVALALAVAAASPASGEEGRHASRAEQLFAESAVAYKAGRFDEAIQLLVDAHALSGEPVLLFNLAKAQEGKGDLPAAILSYERYLRDATMIPDRGAIEQRLVTLRGQVDARAALERRAEEERALRERAERERSPPSPLPWVLSAVGVAGLVTGGALAALAKSTEADAQAAPVQLDAASLRDDAEDLATGANAALAIGGAVLAGAVAWGIVDVVLSTSGPDRASSSLHVGPLGAWYETRF